MARLRPFVANGRYLRIPDGWSRREAVIPDEMETSQVGEQAASRDPSKRDGQTGEILELRLAARELPHRFLPARDPFGLRRRFALRHDVQEAVLAEFARVGVDRFGEIALEKALHVGNDCVVDPRVASRVRTVNAFESDNSLSTKDPVDKKVIG